MNKYSTLFLLIIVVLVVLLGLGMYMRNTTDANATNPTATTTVSVGGDSTDTTGTTPVTDASEPTVVTKSDASPTDTTAVVTGVVNPNGAATSYWYEYGPTDALGMKTITQNIGSGFAQIPAPALIKGLPKNTTFYFRLVAQNSLGVVSGNQYFAKTSQTASAPIGTIPTARTLAASGLSKTSALVTGDVTPNKVATQYWFEYGTNGTLGNTTGLVSVGSGSALVSASASLTGLAPSTTYYFRINAQNQYGTVNGEILTFKTAGTVAGNAPVVTTQVPNAVTATSATLRGTVLSNGIQTTYHFEYGTDAQFASGSTSVTAGKSVGAGSGANSIQANVSGLKKGSTYYYRVVAENSAGIVRGETQTFLTK